MKMQPFCAASPTELNEILHANDVCVPPLDQGQDQARQERSEISIICRFLATIAKTNLLEFPVRVEPRERPDRLLTMPSGDTGIEITEAVPEHKAEVDASLENEGSESFHYIPPYRVRMSDCSHTKAKIAKIKKIEIEEIKKDQKQKFPHMGNNMERDWAEAMLCCIKHKAEIFQKPGFKKYPKNWLLIYDNWSPAAGRNNDIAVEMLGEHILALNANNPFCKVFVQGPCNIWDFTNENGIVKYPVPMDWLQPFGD